ncbi:MAG TPA: hypothetical protein VJ937_06000 [Salinivirga sp.]|uniref:hypothetical protein n=1 Tax=Salinivirga sp. TaxID=1970192 RepID=UPI002B487719|nr:hypothetical protein [Salinivirga sp.]HKK59009.1 hypothetical protein [Salinivirga sp.]
MDFEELQRLVNQQMQEQNNRGIADFQGYSPNEMKQILYHTFSESSPLQMKQLSKTDYDKVPLLNQIKYLAKLLQEKGQIKLTNKGFLPTKIVADLYGQGFIKDDSIESKISKLYKETDSLSVHLTHILLEISGIAKKRKGVLSLTKSGEKLIADDDKLLRQLFEVFATKFNWAYFDAYEDNGMGQKGFGFTLILLAKYGEVNRLNSFYAEKYFKAFPYLLEDLVPGYTTAEEYAANCYSLRTFDRFLSYFGIIKIEQKGRGFDRMKYIAKTPLFDKMIACAPPQARK